ncbi:MAG: response regulator [Oscillatoriales cyanobacterium SM2_2_1]|nr:response regulator [Oscillatoriales cyanobacterium SM2_2_1]
MPAASPSILVVEDAPDNRALIEQVFAPPEFNLTCVTNGAEALLWLAGHQPDLILLDLSLPEIDGWEVATRLKSDGRTAHIPILAVTAHAMKGDREAALSAGCNDYLSKPLDIDLLEERVRFWLTHCPED